MKPIEEHSNPQLLIGEIYDELASTGVWPPLRIFQMRVGPSVSIRRTIARLGRDVATIDDGQDAHVRLALPTVAALPAAASAVASLVDAIRFIAQWAGMHGTSTMPGSSLQAQLKLSDIN